MAKHALKWVFLRCIIEFAASLRSKQSSSTDAAPNRAEREREREKEVGCFCWGFCLCQTLLCRVAFVLAPVSCRHLSYFAALALLLSLFAALNCHRVPLEELITFVGRTRAVMNGVDDGISDYSGCPQKYDKYKKETVGAVCLHAPGRGRWIIQKSPESFADGVNSTKRILRRLGEKFARWRASYEIWWRPCGERASAFVLLPRAHYARGIRLSFFSSVYIKVHVSKSDVLRQEQQRAFKWKSNFWCMQNQIMRSNREPSLGSYFDPLWFSVFSAVSGEWISLYLFLMWTLYFF